MLEHLVGQSLNRYPLKRLIASDSLGTTFQAYDPTLERDLALKVIHPTIGNRPYFAENFTQSVRTSARLDHPNLVEIFDFGEARSYYYVVTEFIPGDSLEQMLSEMRQSGQWVQLGEAVQIVRHLASSLDYVRRQNAPQRSIRPAHIKIRAVQSERLPYQPVLVDLGLAHLIEGKPEENPALAPAYMSPEEAVGGSANALSDVYSLGVLLFELVTGQLPFPIQTLPEAIRYHTRQPLPPPLSIRPDIPAGLEQVLVKALGKNPQERYSTPGALATALDSVWTEANNNQGAPPAFEHAVSLLVPYRQSLSRALTIDDSTTTRVAAAAVTQAIQASQIVANAPTVANPPLPTPSLEMVLENSQLHVEPGGNVSTNVTLVNASGGEKTIRLSVDGVPSAWVGISPQVIRLAPGETREVRLTIQPPRTAQSRAGRYPLTVRAVATQGSGRANEAKGTLTVAAFSQFKVELYTPKLRSGDTGQLHITNLGNTQESYTFNFRDPEGNLFFTPPENLRLEKGQTGIAEFRTQLRNPQWMGNPRSHELQAQVISASGETQTVYGEVISQPVLPTWVVGAFLVLLVCIILGTIATLGSAGLENARATAAVQGTMTQIANAAQGTAGAATATSLAISNANQATIQAVTATSAWLVGDDDGDGLPNQRELEIGTLPNERDTDRDSLSDGDEVARGTDPLRPDTDADGLSDGDEVRNNLDPRNPDTDGDGLPDSTDPNPLQTSTPAPNLLGTAQAATAQAAATQQAILVQTAGAQTAIALAATQTAQAAQNAAAQQTAAAATAQAGAVQQTAAAATAIAATAAAGNAAQQTAAAATAAAGVAATQTAQAQVPAGQVLYVYLINNNEARNYQTLLQNNGVRVDLLPVDALQSNDLTGYQAFIIGPDTGSGDNWGDPGGGQASFVAGLGKPILGLGEGGLAFFRKANPNLTWVGTPGEASGMIARDTNNTIWREPYPIAVPGDRVIGVYNDASPLMSVSLPNALPDAFPLANTLTDENQYLLIQQATFFLWGFNDGPAEMTPTGQQLFINVVQAVLP